MICRLALLLVSAVIAADVLLAQDTGTIVGTVRDPAGLVIANAKVTATLKERGVTRTVTADAEGNYVLPLLPIGTYTITVEQQGFKTFSQAGIGLTANENARVDAKLEVGSVSQEVAVTAEASLVDSRSSTVGTLIDSRRVVDLPINGRNIIALASTLPGVAAVSAPETFTGDRSGPTVSVSGSRQNENLFLFDGADYNAVFRNTGLNYPPPDALQEVKVLTNSFSAEYGRNAGAVFNVVTKSGTNQVHGANPQLIQNQFGAAAGGPIIKNSSSSALMKGCGFVPPPSVLPPSRLPQLSALAIFRDRSPSPIR